jgi:LacI family gluconate utilization system Gnt-I transcriptional repressor
MPRNDAPRAPRTPQTARATVKDVAKLAGVSLMTVSRAASHPDRVAADTLVKVRKAMAETGYVPNMAAVSLRIAQSRLVVAVVPTLRSHMFDASLKSLTEHLAANGYQLLLGEGDYSVQREDELLRTIVARRPDGILVIGSVQSKQSRALLASLGIPVVEAGDLTRERVDMVVGFSHEKLSAAACRFLASRGHKRLAVFSSDDARAMRRNNAFVREAAKLGLEPVHVVTSPVPTHHARGRDLLAALLREGPAVEAIYCSSDMLAAGVLTEARMRKIPVPKGLAVMGTGDIDLAASWLPALTTVRVDGTRIGAIAADMLLQRMAGRTVADPVVDVGFEIVERESA